MVTGSAGVYITGFTPPSRMVDSMQSKLACPILDVTNDPNFAWARERVKYTPEDSDFAVYLVGDSEGKFNKTALVYSLGSTPKRIVSGEGWAVALARKIRSETKVSYDDYTGFKFGGSGIVRGYAIDDSDTAAPATDYDYTTLISG